MEIAGQIIFGQKTIRVVPIIVFSGFMEVVLVMESAVIPKSFRCAVF